MRKFFKKAGNLANDYGMFMADNFLGTFGATDVINEDHYKTGIGRTVNKVTDVVAPIKGAVAATALGGPMAGQAMSSVQQGVGAATNRPQQIQPQYSQPVQQTVIPNTPTFQRGGRLNTNRYFRRRNTNIPAGERAKYDNIPLTEDGFIDTKAPGTGGMMRTDYHPDRVINPSYAFAQQLHGIGTKAKTPEQAARLTSEYVNANRDLWNNINMPEVDAIIQSGELGATTLSPSLMSEGDKRKISWGTQTDFKKGGKLMKYRQGGGIKSTPDEGLFVDYNEGQSHEGPDEGIPVDSSGQPVTVSGGQAVGLTEKGEVTFNGQVFSDTTKLPGNKKRTFADEAKRIAKKYKFYLGDKLDKTEPVSERALKRELTTLFDIQEARKGNMIHQEDVQQLLQEQQEAQAAVVEQEVMQEEMMQDPAMQEQMQMEQQAGVPPQQPMMRCGGRLPKYNPGGVLAPGYSFNTAVAPLQSGLLPTQGNINVSSAPMSTGEIPATGTSNVNNLQPYQPSALPGAAGAAMGLVSSGIGLLRNRKGTQPRLNLSRMTPEQINLEQQRIAARNRATTTGSSVRRDLARRGGGQGQFQAGTSGAMNDINRNLGEQVGQSYLAQESANMQARQQARAANMQALNQERMFNVQSEAQRRAIQDQLIASGLQSVTGAARDYQGALDRAHANNMLMSQGDLGLYQEVDPNAPAWRRRLGMNRGRPSLQAHRFANPNIGQ